MVVLFAGIVISLLCAFLGTNSKDRVNSAMIMTKSHFLPIYNI